MKIFDKFYILKKSKYILYFEKIYDKYFLENLQKMLFLEKIYKKFNILRKFAFNFLLNENLR